ncbi:MAG: helix-turn-helix transcriptional regulator, partial [Clostridia bacterium]|nr:helix-turn-helix transcriptional regulator [Clostridia bacterium]
ALDVFFGNLTTHYGTIGKNEREQTNFLVKVIQYIGENYAHQLTLESVAMQYGYSKFYFSKLFNKLIGMSFSDYVNLVRVQQFVKKFSKNKQNTIMTLASQCGFKSQSSFYRAFHDAYGITPSEYFSLNEPIYW